MLEARLTGCFSGHLKVKIAEKCLLRRPSWEISERSTDSVWNLYLEQFMQFWLRIRCNFVYLLRTCDFELRAVELLCSGEGSIQAGGHESSCVCKRDQYLYREVSCAALGT